MCKNKEPVPVVQKRQANMVDGGKVDIQDVFDAMKASTGKYMYIDGDRIKTTSERYMLFYHKGTTCVCCGLEATYFRKEKFPHVEGGFHLNLYGIDHHGDEVLFTKDHIVAKAKGGKNNLTNYQTMCSPCNYVKADS